MGVFRRLTVSLIELFSFRECTRPNVFRFVQLIRDFGCLELGGTPAATFLSRLSKYLWKLWSTDTTIATGHCGYRQRGAELYRRRANEPERIDMRAYVCNISPQHSSRGLVKEVSTQLPLAHIPCFNQDIGGSSARSDGTTSSCID